MWAWWSRGLWHRSGTGEGGDRRLLVRGVVASLAGGSGTLRSGAGETFLEEGPGLGEGGRLHRGSKEDVGQDKVGEEKD